MLKAFAVYSVIVSIYQEITYMLVAATLLCYCNWVHHIELACCFRCSISTATATTPTKTPSKLSRDDALRTRASSSLISIEHTPSLSLHTSICFSDWIHLRYEIYWKKSSLLLFFFLQSVLNNMRRFRISVWLDFSRDFQFNAFCCVKLYFGIVESIKIKKAHTHKQHPDILKGPVYFRNHE